MSKYSSLLFAPEKYHEIGPFRFPVFNDLVPGEAKRIEEISRLQSAATFKSIKLAQKIAKDKNIKTKEAIDLLSNVTEADNEDLMMNYAEELEELNNSGVGAVAQQIEYVTLFMQYRGEVKMPGDTEYIKTPDWTMEDTEAMPQKYMAEISEMIGWEREGWPEPAGKEECPMPSTPPKKS